MGAKEMEKFDLSKLVAEAGAEVDSLIKAERDRLEKLQKKEESSSSSSSSSSMAKGETSTSSSANGENLMQKQESSRSESSSSVEASGKAAAAMMKQESSTSEATKSPEASGKAAAKMMKDENSSGYESQAPEASNPASAPAAPSPEDGGAPAQDGGEDLQSMVSSLDDQMLDELMQVVMMEKEARKGSAAPQSADPASQAASPASPADSSGAMAMKAEIEKYQEKLVKSEENAAILQKSVTAMTDLLDKMINKPVQKAVTDVRNIEYIDKGEKLNKAEPANISDADLKQKANEISRDPKKLGALEKRERDVLLDFLMNKKRTPEVLKIVSK